MIGRKLLIGCITLMLISLTSAGCGGNTGPENMNITPVDVEVKGLTEAIAEQPVMLTSVGQSADVQMVKALMDKAEIAYEFNTVVKPEEMEGIKTLVLAVGGSSKGLGAAGIKAEEEIERTKQIIAKAKEKNMTILALHIGGEARRGELSDQFVHAALPDADYIIAVEEGNKDGLLTKLAAESGIPMDTVTSIAQAAEPLKKAFK